MIYVCVMYSDLTVKRELLGEIEKLPKDNVLFILVKTDQREGKLRNIASCQGFDNYMLCQRRDNSQDWVLLFGWDEDDFVWRRTSECVGCKDRIQVDAPIGINHVTFRGGSVSQEVWDTACAKFSSEMG